MSWNFLRESIIKKTPGKDEWCVESESGKNLGCSDSREAAEKRLEQVEMFKHKIGATDCPVDQAHIHEDLKEFKEIDNHLGQAKKVVKNMVNEDHQALKQMASGYATTADLGTHGDGNSDTNLYHDTVETDLTNRDKQTHPNDQKDVNGVDPGFNSQRQHNETMLTDQVMQNRKELPKVDFRDPKQPSSNADGNLYDGANRPDKAPEGEVLGLQPSYSAAELYIAITPRQEQWGFKQESLFDTFIGNVGQILADCKAHGASRAAAREAAIKVHSTLFAKHEWMSPILDRFLDRTYGTAAKPKSALSTLEGCISDFVVTAHKNGWDKQRTLAASCSEFSSWIENYPDTQAIIDNKVDAAYGVSPEVISKFMTTSEAGQAAIQLRAAFTKFPIPYAEFRRWCSAQKVPVPTLYALERIAMELSYITMPETLVIFSEKDVYVSEDKTKTVTQERPADPNQQPNEMKLADGTTVTRTKKITE